MTGKRPFDGDSQFSIMSAHLEKPPVPPITLNPGLPVALNDLILLSVNREPGARFQSAEAFRNALNNVMGMSAPVPAAAEATAAPHAAKSHRALWVTTGALCCVGVLVAVVELGPRKKAAADDFSKTPTTVAAPAPNPAAIPPNTPAVEPASTAAAPTGAARAASIHSTL